MRVTTLLNKLTEVVPWARHRSSFTRHLEDAVGCWTPGSGRCGRPIVS
jgi:hypothetical protein